MPSSDDQYFHPTHHWHTPCQIW